MYYQKDLSFIAARACNKPNPVVRRDRAITWGFQEEA